MAQRTDSILDQSGVLAGATVLFEICLVDVARELSGVEPTDDGSTAGSIVGALCTQDGLICREMALSSQVFKVSQRGFSAISWCASALCASEFANTGILLLLMIKCVYSISI